jgi:hypothetical protein
VISRLGTGEVIEITPTLLDCHEKTSTKAELSACRRRKTTFCAIAKAFLT